MYYNPFFPGVVNNEAEQKGQKNEKLEPSEKSTLQILTCGWIFDRVKKLFTSQTNIKENIEKNIQTGVSSKFCCMKKTLEKWTLPILKCMHIFDRVKKLFISQTNIKETNVEDTNIKETNIKENIEKNIQAGVCSKSCCMKKNLENVRSVFFSSDDSKIFVVDTNGVHVTWNLVDKKNMSITNIPYVISAYSQNENSFVGYNNNNNCENVIFDVQQKQTISLEGAKSFWLEHATYSSNGEKIAAIIGKNNVNIWDAKNGKLLKEIIIDTNPYQISFSPDEKTIAIGSFDGVRIYDIANGKLLKTIKTIYGGFDHKDDLSYFAFSPDGEHLATSSYNREVKIWNLNDGRCVKSMSFPRKPYSSPDLVPFAFFPDGKKIAIAGTNIEVWDITSDKCIPMAKIAQYCISSMVVSSDGSKLAVVSNFGNIHIMDFAESTQSTQGDYFTDYGLDYKIWDHETKMMIQENPTETVRLVNTPWNHFVKD